MTKSEIDLISSALELLHKLVPDDPLCAYDPTPRRCPVEAFARHYLMREPGSSVTSSELWQFYAEIAASGELELLTKGEFLHHLPRAMDAVFGIKKSHDIKRAGGRQRGFKGVGISEETSGPGGAIKA